MDAALDVSCLKHVSSDGIGIGAVTISAPSPTVATFPIGILSGHVPSSRLLRIVWVEAGPFR